MKKSSTVTTLSILERIAAADDSVSTTLSKSEFRIFRELEASGHIEGQIGPDTHDAPETMVEDVSITTEGRLLMERLLREKRAQSFWSVTWRWLGPALGFVAGIASPVVVAYLKKKWGL
jgi:hypothetical protein